VKRYNKTDEKGMYAWQCLSSYSEETYEKLKEEGRLKHDPQKMYPRYKLYLDESLGNPLTDMWSDIQYINSNNKERLDYQTQKPLPLLERIIKAGSNPGDLVADFYLGSGTTAEACEILGRNFIGCDINPKAVEMAQNRCISI
jgi:adenine-specific DNA-methyltransferase